MGLFFEATQKGSPPWNMSYISYNDDTSHSYTLPKENPKKYINHVTHHLSSAGISIFHQKSAHFAIPGNADIDCIWKHNC